LNAIVVLGAIAVLLNDENLLEAAISEIMSMSPQERRELDHLRKVDTLLLRQHLMQVRHSTHIQPLIKSDHYHFFMLGFGPESRPQGSLNKALEIARQAVNMDPENAKTRLKLVEILLQQSDPSAALDNLRNDSADMSILSAQLRFSSLAKIAMGSNEKNALDIDQEKRTIEQAIFLAPWDKKNWTALAYAESQI
jgi:superkiller protein 3